MEDYSLQGKENLEILSRADNFTDWMYLEIKPFLKGNILEIGSGTGTYSKKIINDFIDKKIVLSDIDDDYIVDLKKYENDRVFVYKINFENEKDLKNINISIDSVVALNVLEHVRDDVRALKNIYNKLASGGRLVVLVPAHKFLFNSIDRGVDHYRRYSKKDLLEKISQTGFKIKKISYFNFLSIFGWFWTGNILKRNAINERAVTFFDKLVPFLRFFEKYLLRNKMGISLIAVLEK